MQFKTGEFPPIQKLVDPWQLATDEIIIDGHGVPWIIQASDEVLAVLNKDRQVVSYRYRAAQLVWQKEKLKRHTDIMLIDVPAGPVTQSSSLIEVYHPTEIVRAIRASEAAFDRKLAAL